MNKPAPFQAHNSACGAERKVMTWIKNVAQVFEKVEKFTFSLICSVTALIILVVLGTTILGSLRLGLIAWCVFMALSVSKFLVSVPEVTGLLTINIFSGKLIPYGTGLHFRYPWEQVKEGNYINLQVITEDMSESYPAQDGPEMILKWSFQYRPYLNFLERYISADDNTIKKGFKDVGSSILSANIAGFKAGNCKKNQQAIEKELKREFEEMKPTPEELYGTELVRVSLADVDYEPTVQAVRASEQVAAILRKIATAIRKDHPEITQKDAMNAAMIIHGKIQKNVVEVEGHGGEALAALLIAMSRGGGK